jgi:FG-GAP repeat
MHGHPSAPRVRRLLGECGLALALGCSSPALAQAIYLNPEGLATSEFGRALARGWDGTGDGLPDLLVGAPGSDPGSLANAGAVYFLGSRTGQLLGVFVGTASNDALGSSIAVIGDIDSDGVPDFIVGSPLASYANVQAGRATIVSGATVFEIRHHDGGQMSEFFGTAVGVTSDVNNDGFPDYLVGAPGYTSQSKFARGRVAAYSGRDGAFLYNAVGDSTFDSLGTTVLGVPDVNGDGHGDFLTGAPGYDNGPLIGIGLARLCSGSDGTTIHDLAGEQAGDSMGSSLALDIDRTGDGHPDYLIGAPAATRNQILHVGMVYLVAGTTMSVLGRIEGNDANGYLGTAVTASGDVSGDGVSDIAASAPELTAGGSVFLYSGTTLARLYRLDATQDNDGYGQALCALPDADNDGYPDYVIGVPFHAGGQIEVRRGLVPEHFITGSGKLDTDIQFRVRSEANEEFLLVYDLFGGPTITRLGTFFIGFSPYWGLTGKLFLDDDGGASLPFHIPNDPAFLGITLYTQALVFTPHPPNQVFLLSQGANITFN